MTLYTIKTLTFVRRQDAKGNWYSIAETPFGDVTVYPQLDGSGYFWEWSEGKDYGGVNIPTIDAAESAAREWWRARMVEGLEVAKPQVEYRYERDAIDAG